MIIRSFRLSLLVATLIITVATSCDRSPAGGNDSRPVEITDLGWLNGAWKSAGGQEFYEIWKMQSDSLMVGKGYVIRGNDTVFSEVLSISSDNGNLVYLASVKEDNHGRAIPFFLQNNNPDSLIFSNIDHDFPKMIIYSKLSDNHLDITIQGDKKDSEVQYNMQRFAK